MVNKTKAVKYRFEARWRWFPDIPWVTGTATGTVDQEERRRGQTCVKCRSYDF